MKNSKALMVRAGIYPRLKLGIRKKNPQTQKESVHSTGPHKVRVIDDKITKGRDRESGQIIDVMKYVLEVDGVKKEYRCPIKNKETGELHYLVQIFSNVEPGTELILEMKKQGPRNYVEVRDAQGNRLSSDESDASEVAEDQEVDEDALADAFDEADRQSGAEDRVIDA